MFYKREHLRAGFIDYNTGTFHIIIHTSENKRYIGPFGYVKDGHMYYSLLGDFVHNNLTNVSKFMSYIHIPTFSVMPDHLHLLIIVYADEISQEMCVSIQERMLYKRLPIISSYINHFKGTVTHFANEHGISFMWQKSFKDFRLNTSEQVRNVTAYIQSNTYNIWKH